MNYNKHLEELQKFRDAIRDIQNEVEKMRDDAVRRGAPITFDRDGGMRDKKNSTKDGSHLTNDDLLPGEKLYKENILDESVQKWWKKLAGITDAG